MDGFMLATAAICAALTGWIVGQIGGYDAGCSDGYMLGYAVGEFKALCSLIERDMDEGGDAE